MKNYIDFKNGLHELHKMNRIAHIALENLEELKISHKRKIQKLDERMKVLKKPCKEYADVNSAILEINGVKGEVLFKYYIEGEPMKNIAADLGYTDRRTWALWEDALKELYDFMYKPTKEQFENTFDSGYRKEEMKDE